MLEIVGGVVSWMVGAAEEVAEAGIVEKDEEGGEVVMVPATEVVERVATFVVIAVGRAEDC